jgi:hypothetical protein
MKTIFTILLFLVIDFCLGQEKNDIETTLRRYEHSHTHKEYVEANGNSHEIEIFFSGLFLFYKTFFSSQDGVSCVFEPSCSSYALQSIKKKGLFLGGLSAFDRLTRCNGFSVKSYSFNPKTGLLIDPP